MPLFLILYMPDEPNLYENVNSKNILAFHG